MKFLLLDDQRSARTVLKRLLEEDDNRAIEVSRTLDELAHAREVGDWVAAESAARRLVGWVVL